MTPFFSNSLQHQRDIVGVPMSAGQCVLEALSSTGDTLRLRVLLQNPNVSFSFEKQGQGKIAVVGSGNTVLWGSFLGCYGENMSCCAVL